MAISPQVSGESAASAGAPDRELRVHRRHALVSKTLAAADVRGKTGATIIGKWINGELDAPPSPTQALRGRHDPGRRRQP